MYFYCPYSPQAIGDLLAVNSWLVVHFSLQEDNHEVLSLSDFFDILWAGAWQDARSIYWILAEVDLKAQENQSSLQFSNLSSS